MLLGAEPGSGGRPHPFVATRRPSAEPLLGLALRIGVVLRRGREHLREVDGRGVDLLGADQALDEHPTVLAPRGHGCLGREVSAHPSSVLPSDALRTAPVLLRWVARSSVPRYDAMTSGSLRIVVGRALGDDPTGLHAVHAVGDRHDQREIVLDDDQGRVQLQLHPLDQGTERLGFALGHARGRLVEADHPRRDREDRRELDDAPGAGRELGDEPVRVPPEPEEVDQLRGFGPLRPLGAGRVRQVQQRSPERRPLAGLERELHRLAHRQLGKQRGGLERAAQARVRSAVRREVRDVPAEEVDPALARDVAPDRVEQRRLAGAVGPDEPDDLAGFGAELDGVDRDEPAEQHGEPGGRDHAAVRVLDDRATDRRVQRHRGRGARLRRRPRAGASPTSSRSSRGTSTRSG